MCLRAVLPAGAALGCEELHDRPYRSTTGAKVLLDSEMLVENFSVEVSLQGQDMDDQTSCRDL